VVVFLFIFATSGLLVWAAVKPWAQGWIEVRIHVLQQPCPGLTSRADCQRAKKLHACFGKHRAIAIHCYRFHSHCTAHIETVHDPLLISFSPFCYLFGMAFWGLAHKQSYHDWIFVRDSIPSDGYRNTGNPLTAILRCGVTKDNFHYMSWWTCNSTSSQTCSKNTLFRAPEVMET
jgi:hypothetical protein